MSIGRRLNEHWEKALREAVMKGNKLGWVSSTEKTNTKET